jgi:hypothetical protein
MELKQWINRGFVYISILANCPSGKTFKIGPGLKNCNSLFM